MKLDDKKYASGSVNETQNQVDKRIKEETQYLESLVLFRDVEETKNKVFENWKWSETHSCFLWTQHFDETFLF